jgi:hypothetical protein
MIAPVAVAPRRSDGLLAGQPDHPMVFVWRTQRLIPRWLIFGAHDPRGVRTPYSADEASTNRQKIVQ